VRSGVAVVLAAALLSGGCSRAGPAPPARDTMVSPPMVPARTSPDE
jgi:hypothetical protein